MFDLAMETSCCLRAGVPITHDRLLLFLPQEPPVRNGKYPLAGNGSSLLRRYGKLFE
ncbi:hypothetical protein [Geobacter anodireducens]